MNPAETISTAFVSARCEGRAISAFPGDVPATLAEAYAVQYEAIRKWDDVIAGFKVGGIAPDFADHFPGRRLAGPVFKKLVQPVAQGGSVDVPVFSGGFAAYEAEFVMMLEGLDRLSGTITDFETAKSYVSSLHIGAEIASSPLSTLNALGPGSIISDFGNQAGVIVGPEIDLGYLDCLHKLEVTLTIDDEEIGRAKPPAGDGGPLDALRFLLNHLQTLPDDIQIPEHILLSSGAVTGVHEAAPETSSTITFADLGSFSINMTAHEALNTSETKK